MEVNGRDPAIVLAWEISGAHLNELNELTCGK